MQGVSEMAKVRGTGMSSVNYPTGMNLGGDPTQALIHMTTTGTFIISLASSTGNNRTDIPIA